MNFEQTKRFVIGALAHGMDFDTAFSLIEQARQQKQERKAAPARALSDLIEQGVEWSMQEDADPQAISQAIGTMAMSQGLGRKTARQAMQAVGGLGTAAPAWDETLQENFDTEFAPVIKSYRSAGKTIAEARDAAKALALQDPQVAAAWTPELAASFDSAVDSAWTSGLPPEELEAFLQTRQENAMRRASGPDSDGVGLPPSSGRGISSYLGESARNPAVGALAGIPGVGLAAMLGGATVNAAQDQGYDPADAGIVGGISGAIAAHGLRPQFLESAPGWAQKPYAGKGVGQYIASKTPFAARVGRAAAQPGWMRSAWNGLSSLLGNTTDDAVQAVQKALPSGKPQLALPRGARPMGASGIMLPQSYQEWGDLSFTEDAAFNPLTKHEQNRSNFQIADYGAGDLSLWDRYWNEFARHSPVGKLSSWLD